MQYNKPTKQFYAEIYADIPNARGYWVGIKDREYYRLTIYDPREKASRLTRDELTTLKKETPQGFYIKEYQIEDSINNEG